MIIKWKCRVRNIWCLQSKDLPSPTQSREWGLKITSEYSCPSPSPKLKTSRGVRSSEWSSISLPTPFNLPKVYNWFEFIWIPLTVILRGDTVVVISAASPQEGSLVPVSIWARAFLYRFCLFSSYLPRWGLGYCSFHPKSKDMHERHDCVCVFGVYLFIFVFASICQPCNDLATCPECSLLSSS